ncbi:MAG TPA: hypothetical protein VHF22_04210, partial [Planctomycetota bacterium]|nr:hypothetical protein [Planctomycetota bacterium]
VEPLDESASRKYELSIGERLSEKERAAAETASLDPRKRFLDQTTDSARLLEAQGYVLFPKLKTSVRTQGLAGAIALQGADLLDAPFRGGGVHHARRLADHLEVGEPDLIVTDAIEVAAGGSELTERGSALYVVLVATNAVAHDATAARILGIPPQQVDHVKIASERGYGPLWANEIEHEGDMGVGQTAAYAKAFGPHGAMPVVDFPKRYEREMRAKVPVEVIAAAPWDAAGAQGAVLDWLYWSYDQPKDVRRLMQSWPPFSVVVGRFPGKPPEPQHGRVVVVGDAAIEAWGKLGSSKSATLVPGDPPGVRELVLGFARATGVRPPLAEVFAPGFMARLARFFGPRSPAAPPPAEPAKAADIERLKRRKGIRDGSIVEEPEPESDAAAAGAAPGEDTADEPPAEAKTA